MHFRHPPPTECACECVPFWNVGSVNQPLGWLVLWFGTPRVTIIVLTPAFLFVTHSYSPGGNEMTIYYVSFMARRGAFVRSVGNGLCHFFAVRTSDRRISFAFLWLELNRYGIGFGG